jgi:hypothetical protein
MKDIAHPCHLLPKAERCDHAGRGGFMGHTCEQRAETIIRRALARFKRPTPPPKKARKHT